MHTAMRLLDRPPFRRGIAISLFLTFAMVSGQKAYAWISSGHLAVDVRIYREAAVAALAGGDPWAVRVDGYLFAAPPPTLLPYLPAALVPESVATVLYMAVFAAAAVLTVRALALPIWWVLFPPLSESVLSGNPDAILVLLLLGGPLVAGVAPLFKVYAAIPLLLRARWRAAMVAAILCGLSLPLWARYLESEAVASLADQAGSLSAWGTVLVVPVIIGLVILRRRGAEWLVVPALWPYTQLHYSAIALPAVRHSPLLAFLMSFGIPLLPALAVIAEAARVSVIEWSHSRGRNGVASTPDPRAQAGPTAAR